MDRYKWSHKFFVVVLLALGIALVLYVRALEQASLVVIRRAQAISHGA